MEVAHIVHPRTYNPEERKFFREAFRNNRGSLSIISFPCLAGRDTTICAHLRKYFWDRGWTKIITNPPVFWVFNTDEVVAGGDVKPDEEDIPCHYIVEGLTNAQLFEKFQDKTASDVSVCENGSYRFATHEELLEMKRAYEASENNA